MILKFILYIIQYIVYLSNSYSAFFTVPPPTISVIAPTPQIVGQPLTLECSVTAVRGITSRVDIIWSRDGEVLNRTNAASPTVMDSSLVYTDLYTIPQLCLCPADQDIYQCEMVINTSPPITATDSVTLNVTADCETSTTACRYLSEYKQRGYVS